MQQIIFFFSCVIPWDLLYIHRLCWMGESSELSVPLWLLLPPPPPPPRPAPPPWRIHHPAINRNLSSSSRSSNGALRWEVWRWFIIPAARWKLKISRSGIPRRAIWHSFTFVHSNAKKMCAYTYEITIVIEIALKNMPKFDFYLLDSSFIRNNRQTDTTTMMPIILLLFHWFFIFIFHRVSCCLAGHQLSINEPSFMSTFFLWPFIVGSHKRRQFAMQFVLLLLIFDRHHRPKDRPSLRIFCAFDSIPHLLLQHFLLFFCRRGDNENAVIENRKKERQKYDQLLAYLPG